jgi:hypothetical protein
MKAARHVIMLTTYCENYHYNISHSGMLLAN